MKVPYSHLTNQFTHPEEILDKIRKLVVEGSFTLGPDVEQFEKSFAALTGVKHAIGVANGTDALTLALRALKIGPGDEVITQPNTFVATVGAISEVGAKPVFVDVTPYFTMDPDKIEAAVTPKTKAILPVHLTGEPSDMDPILAIAKKHNLFVVEDACQAIGATYKGKRAGSFGDIAAFSLHPLKNLNVWGDGGVITTHHDSHNKTLRLLRNHGLKTREEVEILGFNSRLDSLQAIVGNWLIGQLPEITAKRQANARFYDEALLALEGNVRVPPRRKGVQGVYHLYIIEVKERDALHAVLNEKGVEAKIHYPIPLHFQKALKHLGYKKGDFPVVEHQAERILSLPCHQHLRPEQRDFVVTTIQKFYRQ